MGLGILWVMKPREREREREREKEREMLPNQRKKSFKLRKLQLVVGSGHFS